MPSADSTRLRASPIAVPQDIGFDIVSALPLDQAMAAKSQLVDNLEEEANATQQDGQSRERMIGPLTATERKAKVQRWMEKRRRQKAGNVRRKYTGRMKFANARPRVNGRFVPMAYM